MDNNCQAQTWSAAGALGVCVCVFFSMALVVWDQMTIAKHAFNIAQRISTDNKYLYKWFLNMIWLRCISNQ